MSGRPITRNLGRVHVPPANLPSTAAVNAAVAVSGGVYPNGATVAMAWATKRENDPVAPPRTAVATAVSNAAGAWSASPAAPASAGTYVLATWPANWPRNVTFHGPVTVS